ncbi:DUF6484 domain-containing protein [Gilvimarinus japonicus]|uniref:DUF6484 domain-containing protein n=1 Tax=Gilvimarinus japonicus TaxID=1796469 RepID=A0ABV7HTR2_9GAMM
MKTDASSDGPHQQADNALDTLIQRPRTSERLSLPNKVDGIVIGTLERLDDHGTAYITLDTYGLSDLPARSLVALSQAHQGQSVAVGFEAGNPSAPLVLGLLQHSAPTAVAPTHDVSEVPSSEITPDNNTELHIEQQGTRILIEAEQELELRCGEAVILLTADGHIQLRGGYITSHADASQRIRGGSVQIN